MPSQFKSLKLSSGTSGPDCGTHAALALEASGEPTPDSKAPPSSPASEPGVSLALDAHAATVAPTRTSTAMTT